MKANQLEKLGVPSGYPTQLLQVALRQQAANGIKKRTMEAQIKALLADPEAHENDPVYGAVAKAIKTGNRSGYKERDQPAPWRQWGADLDEPAVRQMQAACRLPVAVAGALMPDAHVGYGLPIGGVLATDRCVIPYAVGVDIACRMRLTVLDIPPESLEAESDRLIEVLEKDTRFGVGARFKKTRDHKVMDRDWSVSKVTAELKPKAWSQLGTSGSGNHFVEYGLFHLDQKDLGLAAGTYLAILSHSGSRGTGAAVAAYYSKLARAFHMDLPDDLKHLAWLELDQEEGQEYWAAMELMGHYAAANHEVIHREMVKSLKARVLATVENHHNFAWKERHGDREVIVHRKGATPAGEGVLGVIPGSMATPGFVVRGLGSPESLLSASHGAGRVMSRTKAKKAFDWKTVKKQLERSGVTLLSAGLDEVPGVYKDIHQVMDDQRDLVSVVGRFDPKIVKMAPAGERPED
ncbi:MAG: RtcB family protein [Vulcanimicrobiota bacterium]